MELAGKDVVVKISGIGVVAVNLATTTYDDKTYQISDLLKQVLALDTSVIVKDDGIITTEKYTVERLNGKIFFEVVDATRVITVDATYLPLTAMATAHVANYSKGVDLHEVPTFLDEYKKRIAGLKFASGTLERWDILEETFFNALTSSNPIMLEYKHSDTGKINRLFALLESEEMSAAIDGVQNASVSFISTDKFIRY